MADLRQCSAIKADGVRCGRLIPPHKEHCYSHDESRAQERRETAIKAGRVRSAGGEIAQIKGRIRELADGVVDGTVDKARASVAFQGFGVLARVIELERKQKEIDEVEARLAALESDASGERSA